MTLVIFEKSFWHPILCDFSKENGVGIATQARNDTDLQNIILYQNISLRVPRSRQAQKKAILLALKLRRLSGHIRKKRLNGTFTPLFPNRLGEQPVWCCPQRAYLRLVQKIIKKGLFLVTSWPCTRSTTDHRFLRSLKPISL